MTELRPVPSTQWVGWRGYHPGALIEIRRVTDTAVYYRTIREGAGTGPRARKGGPKNRLGRAEFLLNYRPNTKRDWQMATVETLEDAPVTDAVAANGRLHADEEAIADAIRSGAKYHDVQRDYHVQGRVLAQIIEKYGVPYESTRVQREAARAAKQLITVEQVLSETLPQVALETSKYPERDAEAEAEEAAIQALEPLHPQEAEIAEVLRTRAASYKEVLATYHVSPTLVARIRSKHNIPAQTPEEKAEVHRRHYERKKAEQEERRAAEQAELEQKSQEALESFKAMAAEAEAAAVSLEPAIVQEAIPAPPQSAPVKRWQVLVRTAVVCTLEATDYDQAAKQVLSLYPGGEILSVVMDANDAYLGGRA